MRGNARVSGALSGGKRRSRSPATRASSPSVVVGALLLTLVAAAFPLFLSGTEGDLLRARIADPTIGRNGAGLFYSITNVGFREKAGRGQKLLAERLDEEFGRIAADGPHLASPIRFVLGADTLVTLPGEGDPESGPVTGRIFSGTHAERHVELIDGDGSSGALVPDSIAEFVGVGPGDDIQLNGGPVVRVGGIYRALYKSPTSGYWSPWSEQIFRECPDCPEQPQFILVGRDDAVRLTRELRDTEARDVDYAWVAPIENPSLERGRGARRQGVRISRAGARSRIDTAGSVASSRAAVRDTWRGRASSLIAETRSSARRCRSSSVRSIEGRPPSKVHSGCS